MRKAKRFALVGKTARGDGKTPLRSTQFEIVAREFGDDADLHIMKIRFDGLVIGSRCRDAVTDPSEEISFPSCVEAGLKSVDRAAFIAEAGNLLFAVLIGRLDRNGRYAIQFSFIKDGTGFGEPGARDADTVVGTKRALDQGIKNGIFKLLPPMGVEWRLADQIPVHGVILHRGGLWSFIVRANGAAVCKKQRKWNRQNSA